MNVLLPDMHHAFTASLAYLLCDKLGHRLYLLDETWRERIRYGRHWTHDEAQRLSDTGRVRVIGYEEFIDSQIIDVAISP